MSKTDKQITARVAIDGGNRLSACQHGCQHQVWTSNYIAASKDPPAMRGSSIHINQ